MMCWGSPHSESKIFVSFLLGEESSEGGLA